MDSGSAHDDWLADLAQRLRDFAAERDWEQFHSPKNLAMALTVEAAELLEQFQWLTETESAAPTAARRARIEAELADVLIYLVRLADRLDVDLPAAVNEKIELNRRRYPPERVRGNASKYDEYE
jgi:NTP pyrophosphatase (non-canonical NTP hydrolase)